jgi:inner membrane protein COX18
LSSDLPYTVIHTAERFFEGVHFYTHLPWWAVIACCTFTLRSLITLPLAVYQNKILAKRELLAPTVKEYREAVLHNVTIKCRRENVSHKIANRRVMKEV